MNFSLISDAVASTLVPVSEQTSPGVALDLLAAAQELNRELQIMRQEMKTMQENLTDNDNSFFMCTMALIIFLMQCGFAFLEAGCVRSKNATNIIIKNVLDSLLAVIGYWAVGWALAYGVNPNPALDPFFGFSEFFLAGTRTFSKFFFQFVFAATAATIISGAVAERCEFATFLCYSITVTTFTYPILTHWGWTTNGWMSAGIKWGDIKTTYIDFAGSGMVHLTGGTISLLAAYMMGPRLGRFVNNGGKIRVVDIKGHSVPFAALGGFILMFGFLAFNGGSIAEISSPGSGQIVAKVMINTIMCGAFAALTYLVIHFYRRGKWTVLLTINACLTGMVAACAGCNVFYPWETTFVGIGAGLVYLGLSELCVRLRIDDPLDAFAVHFGGGLWGLFSACVFSENGLLITLFRGDKVGQPAAQLGWQMVCAMAIITWSVLTLTPPFLFLKTIGKFRVSEEVEIKGLDIFKHGEAAYPLAAYGHGWGELDNIRSSHTTKNKDPLRQMPLVVENGQENPPSTKRGSYYKNPQNYEHPEHNHLAKSNTLYKRITTPDGVSVIEVNGH